MRDADKFMMGTGVAAVGAVGATTLLTKKDGFAGFVSLLLWTIVTPIYDVCVLDAYFKGMGSFMTIASIVGAVIVNGVFFYLATRYTFKLIKFFKNLVVGTANLFKQTAN